MSNTKVFRPHGGKELVVGDGGKIVIDAGGEIVADGTSVTVADLKKAALLDGLTASITELNKLTGAGAVVASGSTASAVANAKTDYAEGELDTEAEIIAAFNTTNTKLNAVLAALREFKIIASE